MTASTRREVLGNLSVRSCSGQAMTCKDTAFDRNGAGKSTRPRRTKVARARAGLDATIGKARDRHRVVQVPLTELLSVGRGAQRDRMGRLSFRQANHSCLRPFWRLLKSRPLRSTGVVSEAICCTPSSLPDVLYLHLHGISTATVANPALDCAVYAHRLGKAGCSGIGACAHATAAPPRNTNLDSHRTRRSPSSILPSRPSRLHCTHR